MIFFIFYFRDVLILFIFPESYDEGMNNMSKNKRENRKKKNTQGILYWFPPQFESTPVPSHLEGVSTMLDICTNLTPRLSYNLPT
jgi:hypothetical protein